MVSPMPGSRCQTMNMPGHTEWTATWDGLGVKAPDGRLYEELVARYSAPERHYHTLQHLDECFARLAESRQFAEQVHEIELALWFHDAIYDVRSHDNEERSAAWAEEVALRAGLSPPVAASIRTLIVATRHDALPVTSDSALLVDIDLAILGAPAERFDEYERQVRQEYDWVPAPLVPPEAPRNPGSLPRAAAHFQHRLLPSEVRGTRQSQSRALDRRATSLTWRRSIQPARRQRASILPTFATRRSI